MNWNLHRQELALGKTVSFRPHGNSIEKLLDYCGDFTPDKEWEELIAWEKFLNSIELRENEFFLRPMAADIGFHSIKPMYDGQEGRPDCKFLRDTTQLCYYDGSGLNAQNVYKKFLKTFDPETIWVELEKYYLSNSCESDV